MLTHKLGSSFLNCLAEIHKKVSSKEVNRGSLGAVSLSNPNAVPAEAQEEKKPCCKNL